LHSRGPPAIVCGFSESPAVKPARKKTAAPRRSVVIVDDQKPFVDLMAKMIGDNLDCPVHPFTRPTDALRTLPEISAGVIVTDYYMPQMNGIEFIREASSLAPEAVFIIVSGHDLDMFDDELSRLKRLKMRIQKPFGWRPLADAVIQVWPGKDVPSFRG
jgi:DNA-binding NtrC family response regulator